MLEPGCGQQNGHQEDEQVEEGEQVVPEDNGCKCACVGVVFCSSIYIASFPGPRLFRLHEGKSQGLVSKVT